MELPKHLGGHHNRNRVDSGTLNYLIKEFNPKTLVDIGCGLGGTVQLALDNKISAIGIDGDYTIERGELTDKVLIHDYTQGTIDTARFDIGWSVEFLEHVEEKYLPNIFYTFQKCDIIFCTHAVPKQPGYHHVNCQTSEYWINKFKEYGFELLNEPTTKVRELSTHKADYIRKTGMVFKNKNNMEDLKVLCFTPSFHRAKMVRGCMQDVIGQTYKNLHHAVNITYVDEKEVANYESLLNDLVETRNNIHVVYTKNKHNHTNYMNTIKADPNYLNYDIYIKIDDDDIHKKDYVKTVVDFFKKNNPDVVSSGVKYQLNGNLMIVNNAGWGTLGGNPEGSNFKMPMTFAFNRKALDVLLKIENPDKLSGKLWRRRWHEEGLNHQIMNNKENLIWYIHGANITTASFLKKQ
jgi:hypothetical protein